MTRYALKHRTTKRYLSSVGPWGTHTTDHAPQAMHFDSATAAALFIAAAPQPDDAAWDVVPV